MPCSPRPSDDINLAVYGSSWLNSGLFLDGTQLVPAPLDGGESVGSDCGLGWVVSPGAINWLHAAHVDPSSTISDLDSESVLMRFISHLLIDRLPDAGMPDVFQSLGEFYEYYRPIESSYLQAPDSRERAAVLIGQEMRPSFVIEGD